MIHWQQVAATVGSLAGFLAALAAVYFPWKQRHDAVEAERMQHRDDLMRAAFAESLAAAAAVIKADTIQRIDDSDSRTAQAVGDLTASVRELHDKVSASELALAVQFGGNGGGMREAINKQGAAIARVEGRFEQHLAEAGR